VYLQRGSTYHRYRPEGIANDSLQEDVCAVVADFDRDGRADLLVGSGGADFFGKSQPLLDRYYRNTPAGFEPGPLPENFGNTAVLRPFDLDGDGDLDLFVGNQSVTGSFGVAPDSYLLENQGGTFTRSDAFDGDGLGMVTDALWSDFDGDGQTDLIVIGEWMAPKFFKNKQGRLEPAGEMGPTGLWQRIAPFDMDGDGDLDYVLGNWGTNSKFTASETYPLKMYVSDFDANGSSETVVATAKDGTYYPLVGLDDLGSQMVMLRRKYPDYSSFAGQPLEAVLGVEALNAARLLQVTELRSGYLSNEGGTFRFRPFPYLLQLAPVMELLVGDFDGDGREEVLAGGNYFGVKPYQGRLDSFPGALIRGENDILPGNRAGLDFMNKSLRHLALVEMGGKPYLLAVYNDAAAEVYQLTHP
jgi:hypothetical protein